MLTFNEDLLIKDLSTLSHRHRVAFAASCCERMLPSYTAFSEVEGWGDPDPLQQALEEVWNFVAGVPPTVEHFVEMKRRCEDVTPDSEDFPSLLASLAQRASNGILYALDCYLTADPQDAAYTASTSYEAVYMYLSVVNDPIVTVHTEDPSLQEWVDQAPMMVTELQKQQGDLGVLQCNPGPMNTAFIQGLRHSSDDIGIRPYERGLFGRKKT